MLTVNRAAVQKKKKEREPAGSVKNCGQVAAPKCELSARLAFLWVSFAYARYETRCSQW